jgi:hypothetical protein
MVKGNRREWVLLALTVAWALTAVIVCVFFTTWQDNGECTRGNWGQYRLGEGDVFYQHYPILYNPYGMQSGYGPDIRVYGNIETVSGDLYTGRVMRCSPT